MSQPPLDEIEDLAQSLRQEFSAPIDLPEPATRLGLAKREGQPIRQFKHLHQTCWGHAEHLAISGQIKILSLMDGYISCTQSGAIIGHYLYARTILEECAFFNEVKLRLNEVRKKPDKNWMSKGEEFFALLIRFRFSSNDKSLLNKLESRGFPHKLLKPINIKNCISSLSLTQELAALVPTYDTLCDYIHHNGPSHFTTSSGFFTGMMGTHHTSGGGFFTKEPTAITRYQYPNLPKVAEALENTAQAALYAGKACREICKQLPRSPYTEEKIQEMTGTRDGAVYLGQAEAPDQRN
jgi:hypothetical protein